MRGVLRVSALIAMVMAAGLPHAFADDQRFSYAQAQSDGSRSSDGRDAGLSDAEIREILVAQSQASYSGSCACPENVDRGGRRCGVRSAYSKPGGEAPLCYVDDVSDEDVARYRASKGE
jgi:hypothetical protein